MVQKAETLIIGGGAIGICCAYYLNKLGRQVVLVEKSNICSGSSYGNAGLVVPSYSIPLAAPGVIRQGLKWMFKPQSPFHIKPRLDRKLLSWLWQFYGACNQNQVRQSIPLLHGLHMASLKLFDDLVDLERIDCDLNKMGLIEIFNTCEGFDHGVADIGLMKQFGIESRVLAKNELPEFLGGLRANAIGGAYLPQDAHLIPDQFVHQLARRIENKGVALLTSCEVLDFETADHKVTQVKTTKGDILARDVILASGAWSADLARSLRLNLSIQPAKGYSITFKRPEVCPALPIALAEAKVVLTPMADTLRVAGALELGGFDLSINPGQVRAILQAVRTYLPDMNPDTFDLIEIWRGLRPCSPDGLPYIGRALHYDNVVIATGHGMLGISLAPITGKIVSQLIADQKPPMDIAAMRVERFN